MFYLGVDLGASHLKLCLIDKQAEIIADIKQPLSTHYPQTGWAEQSPQQWCMALFAGLSQLREMHPAALLDLAVISFSGGAHIMVLTDAANTVLRPTILWSDQRAQIQAIDLQQDDLTVRESLNIANPTWSLPQLIWLAEHEAELFAKIHRIYFAKDYLRHQLSGDYNSDMSEAVGALLADYKNQSWSQVLMKKAMISISQLPQLKPFDHVEPILPDMAERFGIHKNALIMQGAIDTSMEWLCCGAAAHGKASLKLASAGVVALTINAPHPLPPVSCYPHCESGFYYHAAGINQCTGALDWVRRVFLDDMDFPEMQSLARSVPAGAEGVCFHPYLNGERAPHWNADYRACFSGLTQASTLAHMARAAYEGISMALYDVVRDMRDKTAMPLDHFTILGGGGESVFWGQMLADMMNAHIEVPARSDNAYAGALFARQQDLPLQPPQAHYQPQPDQHKIYQDVFRNYDRLRSRIYD